MNKTNQPLNNMKKNLLFAAMLLGVSAFAQNPYTLSTYTSPYTELTNATSVDLSDEGGDPWDDPEFPLPFGFDFSMNDASYNSTTQYYYGALFIFEDLGAGEQQFFGVYDDLSDASGVQGLAASEISYSIEGAPGSQIAKLQYRDAAYYEEVYGDDPVGAENRTNFQIWFYEDGGVLEVHFGTSIVPDPELVLYGNLGPTILLGLGSTDFGGSVGYGTVITGSPENPTLASISSIYEEPTGLSAFPESGRVFRLTPSNPLGIFDAKAPEFSIYPTITENNLWVKGETNANANYRIMDITGKEVMNGKMQNQNAINVSNLNAGVYLFSIDGMSSAAKFIKK